jgi:hypothetical protein
MPAFEVAFAVALILVALCGLLQQAAHLWRDNISDTSVKLILFLWTLFTIAVFVVVSSGVSLAGLPLIS